MTTRNEFNATDYREKSRQEELLTQFRELMPADARDHEPLGNTEAVYAAQSIIDGYRNMADAENGRELLEAVVWNAVGIKADPNTDYARDVAGLLTGAGVAANRMARPDGERLNYTAARAEQYQAAAQEAVGYEITQLEMLACQHNHLCHLLEGGLINDAGYYAMALSLATLSPLMRSMTYPAPKGGMSEEILAILAETHMLNVIHAAAANDLRHFVEQARDAESRTQDIAELMIRDQGPGKLLRDNPPLPEPTEREPATATAILTLLNGAMRNHQESHPLTVSLVQRLTERANNAPSTAPQQLATARMLATA